MLVRLDNFQTRVNEIADRTTVTKTRISQAEDTIERHDWTLQELQKELRQMAINTDYLEGRSRILGLAEGAELGKIETFLEDLIPKVLSALHLSTPLLVNVRTECQDSVPPPGAQP